LEFHLFLPKWVQNSLRLRVWATHSTPGCQTFSKAQCLGHKEVSPAQGTYEWVQRARYGEWDSLGDLFVGTTVRVVRAVGKKKKAWPHMWHQTCQACVLSKRT